MNCYRVKTANEAFETLYNDIMVFGNMTNVGTKRMKDVCIEIMHPLDNHITCDWRKWNLKYAEREWNWYLSGNPSVEEIKKYAPLWDTMHNGDNIVNSNYGYQWLRNDQLEKCIEQLRSNKDTRQAWLSIFDGKEKDKYEFDTPCTLAVGFEIENDLLNMTVLMRSNDLVYGFCNDQYCFSKLQELVASKVGANVGKYVHFAHDLHIYKKHFNLKK